MKKKNNQKKAAPAAPYIYNPDGINPYDYEVGLLKAIRSKWQRTGQNKQSAMDLISGIAIFKQTLADDFKLAQKHFVKDNNADSSFNDARKALEKYSTSKQKQKDDHYFAEGINKLKQGLNYIIAQLEQEKGAQEQTDEITK